MSGFEAFLEELNITIENFEEQLETLKRIRDELAVKV